MTVSKLCFLTYNGDNQRPTFTVYADAALTVPLDISSMAEIVLTAQRDPSSPIVLTKRLTTSGIAFIDGGASGQFYAEIVPTDTVGLMGFYFFGVRIVDQAGNVSTVSVGRWQVGPSPIWTYSGDPMNSPRDAVRSYINDIDYSNQKLMDAQVDQLIRDNSSVLYAAAAGCEMIARRYATSVDKRVGDLSISYGGIAKNYRDMADDLRRQAALSGGSGTLYAAGISKGDMASYRCNNPDAVGAFTTMTQFDNRGAAGGIIAENVDAPPTE